MARDTNGVLDEIDRNAGRYPQERLVGGPDPGEEALAAAPVRGIGSGLVTKPVTLPGKPSTLGRLISRLDKPVTIKVRDGIRTVEMRVSPRANQETDGAAIIGTLPTGISFVPYHRS